MDNSAVQYIFSLPYKIFFVLELCQNPFFTAFSILSSYKPNPLLYSQLVWFTDTTTHKKTLGQSTLIKHSLVFQSGSILY